MTDAKAARLTLAEMLRGYSVEMNPKEAKTIDSALDRLEPGTEVFLPWIPGANPFDIVPIAAKLRRTSLLAVPHIAARHIESAAQLKDLAAGLVGEAGIDRVLIVGGDREKPAGPYDCTMAVMQTRVFAKAGIIRTAVAGFPEGNPHIPDTVLAEALQAKVNMARNEGLQLSIVTQFCFEAEQIIDWLGQIRAMAIDVPVRIGLAGPATIITLTRYAIRCGIGTSLRVLTERSGFTKLLIDNGPEPIVRGIASLAGRGKPGALPLGIAGLHFYSFGGFKKTIDWINAGRGR